jgi:hypothetical protein
MPLRAALVGAAIVMAAIGSSLPSRADAVSAQTLLGDRVAGSRPTLVQSPACDYTSRRTGQCVEGVDDNPVGASAECGDGLYSHSVTRSGTCSHHNCVAQWCPCGSPTTPSLAGANAPQADADRHFLGLLSQIPGVTILDPSAVTASGRQICTYLQNGDETKEEAITKTMRNTPNGTPGGATAMVNAAISAYCPSFGG